MRLDALFRPKSIAVIGASEKPTIGRRLIVSLDRIGFTGPVFPINPNYSMVLGRTCYPSISDTPEAPDVAVFCLGHRLVLDAFTAARSEEHTSELQSRFDLVCRLPLEKKKRARERRAS